MNGSKASAEEIERIAEMMRLGYTAGQIGDALGRSRNSIIGYAHRTPELRRIGFKHPAPAMYWLVKKRKKIEKVRAKARAAARDKPEPPSPDREGEVTMLELREPHCRWPLWDNNVKTGLYCGRTKTRGSYCERHARQAYGGSSGKAAGAGSINDGNRLVFGAKRAGKR